MHRSEADEPEVVEDVQVDFRVLRIGPKRHHVEPCIARHNLSKVERVPAPIPRQALTG